MPEGLLLHFAVYPLVPKVIHNLRLLEWCNHLLHLDPHQQRPESAMATFLAIDDVIIKFRFNLLSKLQHKHFCSQPK